MKPENLRAELHRSTVSFLPATEDEAVIVQQALFALGCRWTSTGVGVWEPNHCVQKGIKVERGIMSVPAETNVMPISLLTDLPPEARMSDRELMTHYFNQLSARQDRLEEMLKRVLDAVEPKELPKNLSLRKPSK